MAKLTIWQCSQGAAVASVPLTNNVEPRCQNGFGSYVVIDEPATQEVDYDTVVWAAGAGVLMWTAGIAVGLVIAVIRRGRI